MTYGSDMQSPHSWQRTNLIQHSHCSYCGTAYSPGAAWPRVCPNCGETTWLNPLPVAVILLPVRTGPDTVGLVVVRRDIEPARGQLALPGGFIEVGETWQEAAVRELREETGLTGDPEQVALVDTISTRGTLNIFGRLPIREQADLPPSAPTEEASEWLIITDTQPLAFPTHTDVVAGYFASA
ncbi:NUDIX hydrolase [Rugosimonospora africana]|uniref:NUDIX hydrolase n=2 Tax=Rugosimonospora africana TaxID=556532 RepID=A0A8J3QWF6_9ACTN|nr:NUDIX hydrolase [Rugosimonospora africana]